jgi:nucleoside phosphorylase
MISNPSLALFVRIAGGIKDVDIGDVVVATHIHGYERGRATAERFIARPDVGRSSYALGQRGRAVVQAAKWTARIQAKRTKTPRGFVGPIAAGEKVVASDQADVAHFIREHYIDALAVEMEGRGFLEALHMNPNVAGIVIRGISDLLSGKKEADASGWQRGAAESAAALAFEILATHVWPADGRTHADSAAFPQSAIDGFCERSEAVERLLRGVVPGEMKTSDAVALELLKVTDADGRNELFDALLKYQHCSDEDLFWRAPPLIEGCVRMAPWIIGRPQLFEMASHSNFSVRSTAAAICMDLAQYAPDRVPIDLLQRLSVYDEDWYVQAPANAALKAVASSIPSVLRIYFLRLHTADPDEREHAATNLHEVASIEPELLDKEELEAAKSHLECIGDSETVALISETIERVRKAPRRSGYKYEL